MIDLYIWLVVTLLTFTLAILEGIFWHLQAHKVFKFNKHILLVILRYAFVLLLIPFVKLYELLIMTLFVMGIHPSIYYTTRNMIDKRIYPKKWFSEPSSSNSSIFNLKLWHRVLLIVLSVILLVGTSLAQDSTRIEPDFSKMTRSQIRQYRLLIESGYKKQLQQERQYYAYEINKSKYQIKILKEQNEFKIDSMVKYRKLERLNYNKQISLLKKESKSTKDSLRLVTNYHIKNQKILLRIKRNNTRYLYGIIILSIILIATIIYIINKLRKQ